MNSDTVGRLVPESLLRTRPARPSVQAIDIDQPHSPSHGNSKVARADYRSVAASDPKIRIADRQGGYLRMERESYDGLKQSPSSYPSRSRTARKRI